MEDTSLFFVYLLIAMQTDGAETHLYTRLR